MLRKSCFHKFTSFINKWTFRNKMWVDSRKGCKGQCGWRLARSCGIFSINLYWYVGDQIIIIYTFLKYFINRMIAMNQKLRLKGLKFTCDWLWMRKQIFPNIWQPGYFYNSLKWDFKRLCLDASNPAKQCSCHSG